MPPNPGHPSSSNPLPSSTTPNSPALPVHPHPNSLPPAAPPNKTKCNSSNDNYRKSPSNTISLFRREGEKRRRKRTWGFWLKSMIGLRWIGTSCMRRWSIWISIYRSSRRKYSRWMTRGTSIYKHIMRWLISITWSLRITRRWGSMLRLRKNSCLPISPISRMWLAKINSC